MATVTLPAGPRGHLLFGNVQAFRKDPLAFLLQCTREYGDITHLKFGRQDVLLVNHPDLVKDVLVTQQRNFIKGNGRGRNKSVLGEGLLTSQGEHHHRQRRLIQPAFHRKRIANYAQSMVEYSARLAERWQPGETRDIAIDMEELSLAIMCKAMFDVDVETGDTGIRETFEELKTLVLQLLGRRTSPFVKLLDQLPLPSNRRFTDALARFDQKMYQIIAERRSSGDDRGDMLSSLLYEGSNPKDGDPNESMTDKQVRDEVVSVFVAGSDTIAQAMTWSWYLIAQHPDVEAALHTELMEVLGGRLPTIEDLPQLRYTRMILSEALRLYPPFWLYQRRAVAPYSVGGYTVQTGGIVLIASYATHRDPRFFTNPDRFDPMRWTEEAIAQRPKFSYFPFGAGPRLCPGEAFAWMEGVLVIATMAQRWRLRLAPQQVVEPAPVITLRPRGGMPLILEPRPIT